MIGTKEQVKTYLGITDTEHDALLEFLLKGASETVQTLCNRTFDDPAPDDIVLLVTQLAAREFKKRKSQGITSESLGSMRIDWSERLTKTQEKVIVANRYINI